MIDLYRVVLPPGAAPEVRRASTRLDWGALATAGLGAGVYFPGSVLILRLEGVDEPLARFRREPGAKGFLETLEGAAGFDPEAHRVFPFLESGDPSRPDAPLTAVYDLPVLAGHKDDLARALRLAFPLLPATPRLEVYLRNDLVFHLQADRFEEAEALFLGEPGAGLQEILHDHTGWNPDAWREALALNIKDLREGDTFSQDNAQPPDAPEEEGPWAPRPYFRLSRAR